jgi:hypothetical protein
MRSIPRAVPAALAVMVLALTLGLAPSLWTSSDAEAANDPAPVPAASIVDADSCTTFTYGYPYGGFYGYPFVMPYGTSYGAFAYQCVSPAFCVGVSSYYYWQQQYMVCPGPPATIELPATNAATCASATNFTVKVRDANSLSVLDGTTVSFSAAPFGTITGTVETNGGEATASLQIPVKTSGSITLTVQAGSVTQTATINVSCSTPGSSSGGSSSALATQAPPMGGGGGGFGGY